MGNGRYQTETPRSGFDRAAQDLMKGLPSEAVSEFTSMLKEVAVQYYYDDSVMFRQLLKRLNREARKKGSWANDVLRTAGRTAGAAS